MKVIHINRATVRQEASAKAGAEELRLHWKQLARRRVQKIMSKQETTNNTTYGPNNKTI